jgi:hypothetical protein
MLAFCGVFVFYCWLLMLVLGGGCCIIIFSAAAIKGY